METAQNRIFWRLADNTWQEVDMENLTVGETFKMQGPGVEGCIVGLVGTVPTSYGEPGNFSFQTDKLSWLIYDPTPEQARHLTSQ